MSRKMSLPTYDQLALPLMLLLSELDQPIKISDAANILAERSKLSSEVLSQTLPSGKNIFKDYDKRYNNQNVVRVRNTYAYFLR